VAEEYCEHHGAAGPDSVPPEFDAKLLKKAGATHQGRQRGGGHAVLADLKHAHWVVDSVTTKERKKSSVPPFITSKLQQASRFPVKKTMMVAQQLYEGVELPGEGSVGLITYMRTDSTRVAIRRSPKCASSSPARSATSTCRRSPMSSRRSRMLRTRTKRSVRPRCSTTPTKCARS
jgi:DNA topoisomerase IA